MKNKIIIWTLVFLIVVQLASAIGIRPAKTNIAADDFEGEEIKMDGKLWVVNNDHREFTVDIYVEGEMSEYLQIDKNKLSLRPDDDSKEVEFKIKIKKEEVPPGSSSANIVVEERFESSQPNVVSSKVLLKHKINLLGPYPDLYLEGSMNFHEKGDKIEMVAEVKNLGKKDIKEVQATFYVNDKEQKEHRLETEGSSLKTKETKLLTASIDKDNFNEAGQYEVSAVAKYDDQTLELYKTLLIGKPEIEITYFDKYLIAYKVNQYTLDLLNKWNQQIRNVYVEVEVFKEGSKVDSFRTRSVDIEAEMIQRISDYLDAKDKGPGKYTFEMTAHFWSLVRMDEKKFTFNTDLVTEEDAKKFNLAPPALTGRAIGAGSAGSWKWAFISLIGVLAGAAGMYVAYRFKRRDEYQ